MQVPSITVNNQSLSKSDFRVELIYFLFMLMKMFIQNAFFTKWRTWFYFQLLIRLSVWWFQVIIDPGGKQVSHVLFQSYILLRVSKH